MPWHVRCSRVARVPSPSLPVPPMQDVLLRLRYRYWPDHLLGEILSKRWTETAIPVIVLLIITVLLSRAIPGFLSVGGLASEEELGGRARASRERRREGAAAPLSWYGVTISSNR